MRPLLQARMLPPAAFTDRRVLDWELERVYRDGWICAGHLSAVAEPGAYVTRELGGDSFFVIGGEDGVPRAFYNVCRHRAARILGDPAGSARRRIRCPYHAWSYDFEGMLRAAPHTDGLDDFDFSCNGLRSIRTAVVDGLVMVDLGGTAPTHVSTSATSARSCGATASTSCAPRASASTRSTRTGRRSPRTTTSASTARGSTRS